MYRVGFVPRTSRDEKPSETGREDWLASRQSPVTGGEERTGKAGGLQLLVLLRNDTVFLVHLKLHDENLR
ncbi:hypothetical protein E2C01_094153 [Portunus trituberculatus]|uniref:Uncharacterized protein n=1 Tax=Portunus trituberculatus TaxID=210409 RepID=A0A5B7JRQ8_PORTR|nr:hypothetical protein [Portunus trituberculatus]